MNSIYLTFACLLSVLYSHIIVNGKQRCQQYSGDLFLCMEKVETLEDVTKWKRIFNWTVNIGTGLPSEIRSQLSSSPLGTIIQSFNRHSWTADNMQNAADTFDSDHKVETWVAFLWSSTTLPPSPVVDESILNIEMVMSVSTATVDSPNFAEPRHIYSWHMGITRNAFSMFRPGFVFHKTGPIKSSILLHAFAAKVMRLEHPELLYVRSNLAPKMKEIASVAVSNHIGTGAFFEDIPQIESDGQGGCNVYDLDGNLVWNGRYEDFDFPKYPGGCLNTQFIADINLLADMLP